MINLEPFKAKLVRDPELSETKRGPVCNMRVRQVDPGKPSLFIDVAVFEEALAQSCNEDLVKGTEVEITGGLIYGEWKPEGSKQTRSKHSIVAQTVAYETA